MTRRQKRAGLEDGSVESTGWSTVDEEGLVVGFGVGCFDFGEVDDGGF